MRTTLSLSRPWRFLVLAGLLGLGVTDARAHAFIDHAEPAVGSAVKTPPVEVRLWFTEGVETKFNSLKVFAGGGKEVDKKDAHGDPGNRRLLLVSLPPSLPPGTYKVVWRAVSEDTHVTQGDFTFRVGP